MKTPIYLETLCRMSQDATCPKCHPFPIRPSPDNLPQHLQLSLHQNHLVGLWQHRWQWVSPGWGWVG